MNGVTPSRVTTTPLNRPTQPPAMRPATIASGVGQPATMKEQVTTPASDTTEPTDRSNSPMARQSIIARLGMATMLALTSRFSRLVGVRKASEAIESATTMMSSGRARGAAPIAWRARSTVDRLPVGGNAGSASWMLMPGRRCGGRSWRTR